MSADSPAIWSRRAREPSMRVALRRWPKRAIAAFAQQPWWCLPSSGAYGHASAHGGEHHAHVGDQHAGNHHDGPAGEPDPSDHAACWIACATADLRSSRCKALAISCSSGWHQALEGEPRFSAEEGRTVWTLCCPLVPRELSRATVESRRHRGSRAVLITAKHYRVPAHWGL